MPTAEYTETYQEENLSYAEPSPRVAELLAEWQEKQAEFRQENMAADWDPKDPFADKKGYLQASFALADRLNFADLDERKEFAEHAARELLGQIHNFPEWNGEASGYDLYAESQGIITAGLQTRLGSYSTNPGRHLREYDSLLTGLQFLEDREETGIMTHDAYQWIQEYKQFILEPSEWEPPEPTDDRFMSERYFYDGQSLSDQKTFHVMVETLKAAFPDTASNNSLYLPMSEWTRNVAEGFKTNEEVFWMELKGVFDNQEFPDRNHAEAAAADIAQSFMAERFPNLPEGTDFSAQRMTQDLAEFLASERYQYPGPYDQDRAAQQLGRTLQDFAGLVEFE